MTEQSIFNPPLTAEEKKLWDEYHTSEMRFCAAAYAWKGADAAILNRRKRFQGLAPNITQIPEADFKSLQEQRNNLLTATENNEATIKLQSCLIQDLTRKNKTLESLINEVSLQRDRAKDSAKVATDRADKAEKEVILLKKETDKLEEVLSQSDLDKNLAIERYKKAESALASYKKYFDGRLSDNSIVSWERGAYWVSLLDSRKGYRLQGYQIVEAVGIMREGLAAKVELEALKKERKEIQPVLDAVSAVYLPRSFKWGSPNHQVLQDYADKVSNRK